MKQTRPVIQWVGAVITMIVAFATATSTAAEKPVFEKDILPIFTHYCFNCHGKSSPQLGLDLRTARLTMRGSQNGPVVVEGSLEKSLLWKKVSTREMPLKLFKLRLTDAEIDTVRRWIEAGAPSSAPAELPADVQAQFARFEKEIWPEDRQFWAFQKPVANVLPKVNATYRIRTPIDRFVLAKLEFRGLTFSPDASKLTLLRRAYFDLTGLPPTPGQAREFLDDDRTDAYERLIDRLLASPRYGERWGRHWLDVVGYVDTLGKDFNPKTAALSDGYWRYRDYVIAATNKDMPWDRFLVEQIAGDELVDWRNAKKYTPETLELLTATGYLRNVLDATNENISNLPFDRYEALFMLMERVSTSTMGMTLACARCHSHKFDPIPQTDYYRFLSLFTAAYNPSNWLPPKQRHLYHVSKVEQTEIEKKRAEITTTLNKLQQQLNSIRKPYWDRLRAEKLKQIPDSLRADVQAAIETAAKKRNNTQKKLASKHKKQLLVTDSHVDAALNDADRMACDTLRGQIETSKSFLATLRIDTVQALWDVGEAPTIRLLHRGDVDFAGPKVSPGFLTVLSAPGKSDVNPSVSAVGNTTGLRLAFAQWLTSPDHPLTARVIVNRLWQHHFGKGIVETPGNFGATGSRPTHPELLDWLAVEFMQQGWSAKRFHKMMMTSTVYRQISDSRLSIAESDRATPKPAIGNPQSVDPDNRLLWRMNLRRLNAEALRDSVIAVSGQANDRMGGSPVMLKALPSGLQTVIDQNRSSTHARRSIYLVARRSNPLTFLSVFDYPIIDVNCIRRSTSATPLQSLTMINSKFLTTSAGRLASRVEALVGSDAPPTLKIETAYRLTLSRNPSHSEIKAAEKHLQHLKQLYQTSSDKPAEASKRALENFVHMLLCSNEFLYID